MRPHFIHISYYTKSGARVFNFSLIRFWYGGWVKTRIRTISYFLSLVAVAAIFFSVEFITEKYFYPNDEVVDILAAIIGALPFAPCKRFFDCATDKIFFRAPRDERAEFLSNISHELQTPIAILRGNVEVLQSGRATDAERATAERVIVSTLDGMSRLIGNVLESAKLKFSKKILYEQDIAVKHSCVRRTRIACCSRKIRAFVFGRGEYERREEGGDFWCAAIAIG